MLQSHASGGFGGAARHRYWLVATGLRMCGLDGTTWPSLDTVRPLAHEAFTTGRFGRGPAVATPRSG